MMSPGQIFVVPHHACMSRAKVRPQLPITKEQFLTAFIVTIDQCACLMMRCGECPKRNIKSEACVTSGREQLALIWKLARMCNEVVRGNTLYLGKEVKSGTFTQVNAL
jgi:hypothetical protein